MLERLMKKIIDFAFSHTRAILLILVFLLLAGWHCYQNIPKESAPDIPIPIIVVSVAHEGISPKDSERLLLKPLETELKSIEGLDEMSGVSREGAASVTLKFDAGFSNEKALMDVREKVDFARSKLPDDAKEPVVKEVNVALFPILSIALSGNIPERTLLKIARQMQDDIETIPGVLEVAIGGEREEVLDVVTSPLMLETYGVSLINLMSLIDKNNHLVTAGAIEEGAGQMVLKVPGLLESLEDINQLPLKTSNQQVVQLKDVATLNYTFKRPSSIARINGQRAIVLEVKKRMGANIIHVVKDIKFLMSKAQNSLPLGLTINYLQDASTRIEVMLSDLQNNIIFATLLVMIVVIAALGIRPALLVGLSIPGAFLASIGVLYLLGITLNMVVLFSLILVVGMLVDGALVSTELAVRYMQEGNNATQAFARSANRMAWPIIASTATTLVVFIPLLSWPGMVGKFMRFLPVTVIITLAASLFMALIFIPVLGGLLFNNTVVAPALKDKKITHGKKLASPMARYLNLLKACLTHPIKVLSLCVLLFLISTFSYVKFGAGVEFFPKVDADFIQVQVQARGDLSIKEKDSLIKQVESKLLALKDIRIIYGKTIENTRQMNNVPSDTIGIIQLELNDWEFRSKQSVIIKTLREITQEIPGIKTQIRQKKKGPKANKPIELQLRSYDKPLLLSAARSVRKIVNDISGLTDIEDTLPLPGIEWRLNINREKAARFNVDVLTLGTVIQLVTNGIKLSDYQENDSDEEIDIRLKFPSKHRNLEQLQHLTIPFEKTNIPISNFIDLMPAQKTSQIYHEASMPSMTLQADIKQGVLADDKIKEIKQKLLALNLPSHINIIFKGDSKSQLETQQFLSQAFLLALFLMFLILLIQFNRFYQVAIVLSAVVLSTTGVFLGLLISGQTFSIVMSGLGIIALAGIVVNNNIILIDTYNEHREQGLKQKEAIIKTCLLRVRPVLLTSITTILGLLPMVFSMTIDLLGQHIAFGAPSTQWWVQLSSTIAGGLSFATVLTLILTPCLLMLATA